MCATDAQGNRGVPEDRGTRDLTITVCNGPDRQEINNVTIKRGKFNDKDGFTSFLQNVFKRTHLVTGEYEKQTILIPPPRKDL
eukprot:5480637-Lingulodinium_polyedra.AAC.1